MRRATRTARTMGSWYWPAAGLRVRRACPAANTRFGFRVCRGRRRGFRQPAPSGSSRALWPCYPGRPAGEITASVESVQSAAQFFQDDSSCLAALRPGSNYKDKKIRRKSEERSYKVKKDIIKSKCREQSRGRTKFRTCPDTFPMSADISEPKATIQSRPPD